MSTEEPSSLETQALPPPAVLPFDAERYLEHVAEFDLSQGQKVEFLRTLWDIMATFVRMGFDADSALPATFQKASENHADALEQKIPTHEFNVAADEGTDEGRKEN